MRGFLFIPGFAVHRCRRSSWYRGDLAFSLVTVFVVATFVYHTFPRFKRPISTKPTPHELSLIPPGADPDAVSFRLNSLWSDCTALFAHIRTRTIRDTYVEELYIILSLMRCGYHGGFIRYGDSEMALVKGRAIPVNSQGTRVDHVTWDTKNQSALGRRLLQTLIDPAPSIFYGISCMQCPYSINQEIEPLLHQPPGMWSYSVLFHNTNYKTFSAWLELLASFPWRKRVLGDHQLVLLVSEEARGRDLSWADDVHYLPIECIRKYEDDGEALLEPFLDVSSKHHDAIFLISGGPLAKWLVYQMRRANPHNFYVDVGSAMDFVVKGTTTRPYHTYPGTHVCSQH